jgi:hypothetical protein
MRCGGNLTVRTNIFSGIEQIRPSVVHTRLGGSRHLKKSPARVQVQREDARALAPCGCDHIDIDLIRMACELVNVEEFGDSLNL